MRGSVSQGKSAGWSRRGLLAAAVAAPFALTGCLDKTAAVSVEVETGAYPVSLKDRFGTVTIESEPKSIATLGWASNEICVNLGVLPVAFPSSAERGFGVPPWFAKDVGRINSLVPRSYRDADGIPWGDLQGIAPDLIVAVSSRLSDEEHQALEDIAPVVASPGRDKDTDWRTATKLVSQALGRPDAGEELIAAVEKDIADAVAGYEHLKGSTVICLEARAVPGADFELHTETSNPMRILQDFGLVPAPAIASLAKGAKRSDPDWGPETVFVKASAAAALDADVVVIAVQGGEKKELLEKSFLTDLPSFARDSYTLLTTDLDMLALQIASPSSVRWAVQTVLPEVARCAYASRQAG